MIVKGLTAPMLWIIRRTHGKEPVHDIKTNGEFLLPEHLDGVIICGTATMNGYRIHLMDIARSRKI